MFRLFCVDRDAASTLEAAGELKEELLGSEQELRKRRGHVVGLGRGKNVEKPWFSGVFGVFWWVSGEI